jgi:Flp pilus assembly protein TadD
VREAGLCGARVTAAGEVTMSSESARGIIDNLLAEAWRLYGEGKPREAAEALERGNREWPGDIEVLYALGLSLKKSEQAESAVRAFRQVVDLAAHRASQVRTLMLRRLAQGHVNMLERGSWDLEAETWHRE